MGTHNQCLILGSSGQVGKALHKVLGEYAMAKTKDNLDISDGVAVGELLDYLRPDVVVNAASYTNAVTAEANQDDAWRPNTLGADNVAKACALRNIPLIYISCDQVFGADDKRRKTYTEEDATGPTSYMGTTKLGGETAILRIASIIENAKMAKWPFWIIRTSCVFEEPWRNSRNDIFQMMQLTRLRGKMTPLPLPLDVTRSPTYAPHLAQALAWLTQHHDEVQTGIYHVANSGRPATMVDIGFHLSIETQSRFRAEATNRDEYVKHLGCSSGVMPRYTALNTTKFSDICPYEFPTWQEALEEYVAAYAKYEK